MPSAGFQNFKPLHRDCAILYSHDRAAGDGGPETVEKACHCEADSPCQGEMSRRDKRDREAQRADVAIRTPRPLAPLLKGAVSEAD